MRPSTNDTEVCPLTSSVANWPQIISAFQIFHNYRSTQWLFGFCTADCGLNKKNFIWLSSTGQGRFKKLPSLKTRYGRYIHIDSVTSNGNSQIRSSCIHYRTQVFRFHPSVVALNGTYINRNYRGHLAGWKKNRE